MVLHWCGCGKWVAPLSSSSTSEKSSTKEAHAPDQFSVSNSCKSLSGWKKRALSFCMEKPVVGYMPSCSDTSFDGPAMFTVWTIVVFQRDFSTVNCQQGNAQQADLKSATKTLLRRPWSSARSHKPPGMRSQWTELPGDLACDQESMTLKRDGSSRKRRDDRNGKNARIQPHNPTQLTASLVPNATACFVRGLASSVISAPTPHTSEVMVISEDGGRTSR